MIYINDDFSLKSDSSNWIVEWTKDGINPKTKEASRRTTPHYFSSLEQCCLFVLNNSAKSASSVEEIIQAIDVAKNELKAALQATNDND